MTKQVIALSGGIGGTKLALSLSKILDPSDLVVVANMADDFDQEDSAELEAVQAQLLKRQTAFVE